MSSASSLSKWVCVVLLLASVFLCLRADAQSCSNTHPWYYNASFTCDRANTGGVCALSKPLSFSVAPWVSWATASCATVEWTFGDGSPAVVASATVPVSHTYAEAGAYTIRAKITANGFTETTNLFASVANGLLQWEVPPVTEGNTVEVVMTRTNTTGATSVPWQILRNDGTVPADITPLSGTVTMADGVAVARFALTSLEDELFKGTRTYKLKPGPASGGFLSPGEISLTINDDDYPVLDFATRRLETVEQDGVIAVVVNRTGDVNVPVSVDYGVSGTTGVVGTNGVLTFGAGEVSKSFNVVTKQDNVWTGTRTTTVRLSNPRGGARLPNDAFSLSIILEVREDDPPPALTISDVTVEEGNSGVRNGAFTVELPTPVFATVSFRIIPGTAKQGQDYTAVAAAGMLSFSPFSQRATIAFAITGDTVTEDDERFEIEFTHITFRLPPQRATCTILNDDAGVGPSRLRVPAGGTGLLHVDIGSAAPAPLVIALTSSDPSAASVPASVTIPAGEKKASIAVTGVTAHRATEITVQLPAERGSSKFVAKVDVDGSAALRFEPSAVQAVAGQRVPLQLRMEPAPPNAFELPLQVLDPKIAKVPATVLIAADGTGSLEIETLKAGFTAVHATLPDTWGGQSAVLDVDVVTAADKPSLTSLTPATGPAAGGTQFVALGSQLSADCTLSFGGAPATNLTLGADGTLGGLTPPHPAGTVDVALVCGTARSKLARAFTYVSAPPSLTSIAPTFGSTRGGTLVRATGTNFQSGCWMFFGDQAARTVAVDSTTSLVATTPASEKPGAVAAAVRCGDAGAFLASSFAYSSAAEPAASIVSVSPLVGAPGESVTLTGSRFRTTDRIDFDRTAATLLRTRPDEQVVRIPELPLGPAAITLTDADGRVTTTGPIFTVIEPERPQVAKVTPATALPGSEVVLEGRGFRPGYSFAIGGLPAAIVSLDYHRAVVRIAGNTAPGDYAVQVLNAAGKVAAVGAPVRVGNGALRIAGIAPGCGTTNGGTALVLTGDGFVEGASVTLNGVTAADVVVISPTELRATAPPGADGPAVLVVTNADGSEARLTGAFRYSSPFDPQGCVTRVRSVRH